MEVPQAVAMVEVHHTAVQEAQAMELLHRDLVTRRSHSQGLMAVPHPPMEADPRSLAILMVDHHHLRRLDIQASLATVNLHLLPDMVAMENHLCRVSLPHTNVVHTVVNSLATALVTVLLLVTRKAKHLTPTADHLPHLLPTADNQLHLTADNPLPLTADNPSHRTVDSLSHLTAVNSPPTVDHHPPLTDHPNLLTRDLHMASQFHPTAKRQLSRATQHQKQPPLQLTFPPVARRIILGEPPLQSQSSPRLSPSLSLSRSQLSSNQSFRKKSMLRVLNQRRKVH